VLKKQLPVVSVHGLYRPPVLIDPARGMPSPTIDSGVVECLIQPVLLELVSVHRLTSSAG
jgi:hypothetical protein